MEDISTVEMIVILIVTCFFSAFLDCRHMDRPSGRGGTRKLKQPHVPKKK